MPIMDGIRLSVRYLSGIGMHYDEVVEHIEYIDIPHVNPPEWVRFLRFASSLDNLTLLFHLLRIIFLQYIVDDRRRYLYNITVHLCKCYLSMIQYQIPSLKAHHNRFFRYGEWIKSLIDESLDRYSCNPRTSQCTGLEHP